MISEILSIYTFVMSSVSTPRIKYLWAFTPAIYLGAITLYFLTYYICKKYVRVFSLFLINFQIVELIVTKFSAIVKGLTGEILDNLKPIKILKT